MATTSYSARITCEIQACLAHIISSDVSSIVAEYSLRTEQEKLICVLKTAQCCEPRSSNGPRRPEINFNTSAFGDKITKFAIQILVFTQRELEDTHYAIVITGPCGEIGFAVEFNDLCINSSHWMKGMPGLLQTAGIEYRRQMAGLMSRY